MNYLLNKPNMIKERNKPLKKIGLIGIREKINNFKNIEFKRLYEMVGQNTGNLLFTSAVKRQIDADVTHVGYSFKPEVINQNYDSLVIPAANWLGTHSDWGFLADLLEKVNLPCVIFGMGSQSSSEQNIPKLSKGTLKLLSVLSEKSKSLSIRGEYTASVLENYGFKNYTVTGCPSVFYNLSYLPKIRKEKKLTENSKIIYASTRYNLDPGLYTSNRVNNINWIIFNTAIARNENLLFQSEIPEFQILIDNSKKIEFLAENYFRPGQEKYICNTYNSDNFDHVIRYIQDKGRIFFDVDVWIDEMRKYDFFIGSRIHGSISALLSGTPAVLFAHDTRTKEMAEFSGIPFIEGHINKKRLSQENILKLYNDANWDEFESRSKETYKILKNFYLENEIPTNL